MTKGVRLHLIQVRDAATKLLIMYKIVPTPLPQYPPQIIWPTMSIVPRLRDSDVCGKPESWNCIWKALINY